MWRVASHVSVNGEENQSHILKIFLTGTSPSQAKTTFSGTEFKYV